MDPTAVLASRAAEIVRAAEASRRANCRMSGDAEDTDCWGGSLKGCKDQCTPDFKIQAACRHAKNRFQDKFCPACIEKGVELPHTWLRALPEHMEITFKNWRGSGFWTKLGGNSQRGVQREPSTAPHYYRVINNRHRDSVRPMLVVFQQTAPVAFGDPVPRQWISEEGTVTLVLTNGTLKPVEKRAGHTYPGPNKVRRLSKAAANDAPTLLELTAPLLTQPSSPESLHSWGSGSTDAVCRAPISVDGVPSRVPACVSSVGGGSSVMPSVKTAEVMEPPLEAHASALHLLLFSTRPRTGCAPRLGQNRF